MPLSGGGMGCGAGWGFCIQDQAINSRDARLSSTNPECDSCATVNGASVTINVAKMLVLRFIGTSTRRSSKVHEQFACRHSRARVACGSCIRKASNLLLLFYFAAGVRSIRGSL